MSRITELIDCVKIYNLCNHCDHFRCGECSVDDVNCKEEIEKQIVAEIKADAFNEILNEMTKSPFASDKATFVKKYIEEQLKEQNNE